MLITNQPVPKTIEDLGQEVADDVVLARLEQQRAVQDAAIRSYKSETLVVGAPKPSPTASEGSEEEDEELESDYDDDDEGSFEEDEQ